MDTELSEAALAELRRIEANSPCQTYPNPAFKVLWEKGYVMAGPEKTHITERGRRFVRSLDQTALKEP